jgi:putative glycosyltransferase
MELSVVTSLYKSELYIAVFLNRIIEVIKKLNIKVYEIIVIDDGCPNQSGQIVKNFVDENKNIKLFELSKNYGQHKAQMEGLKLSKGDLVYLTCSDLEEDPEILEKLWNYLKTRQDVAVVIGKIDNIPRSLISNFFANIFYIIFNFLSDLKISRYETLSRLMRRKYVDAIKEYQETNIFITAVFKDVGFVQHKLPVNKIYKGHSGYTFSKKITLSINAISQFSSKPLVYIFYLGVFITFLTLLISIWVLIQKFFTSNVLTGFTSIILAIFFVGGLITTSIGVLSIYLSQMFVELKNRPRCIIKNKYIKE